MEVTDQNIIRYYHHDRLVAVREGLRGKHKDYCLCYSCGRFNPLVREKNCPMANALYALDVLAGITTPVWECAEFV